MALFINSDRLSRYFPSAALEVSPTTAGPLLAQVQRLSWKTVAESGSPHSTGTPLVEGSGAGLPHGSETWLEEGS